MEKRFPPFRIGKFEVYLDSWNKSVRISVASWRGGGASFNLQDCSLDLSYGTDRMNAGGFTLHFDKKKRITAGDVLLEASSFVKSRGDVWLTPEACVDDTIIWPIPPFADVAMRGEAMPGEAMPGPAYSKSTTSKHADGRSKAAIRRDAAARQELAARLEAEAKNELMVKLLPFLENHASDESWDKCAEEILRYYYELKEGDFYDAIKYKHWNVTADCIESVDTWESHSFFDDGGGVSGYVRKSIAYVVSEADKGRASETDNRGTSGAGEKKTIDSSAHRYTPGGAPIHKSRYERDPYGLKGLFRLSYERVEEYTD